MSSPPIAASPARLRAYDVEQVIIPYVEALFERVPRMRSVLLAVAQYWADEADDAVHETFVFSADDRPRWPHRCRDGGPGGVDAFFAAGDRCSSCAYDDEALATEEVAYMANLPGKGQVPVYRSVSCRWDDNGRSIRPFQAFCIEGSQELSTAACATPVALFRRGPSGVLLEWLAPPTRAWLDQPGAGLPTWFAEGEQDDEEDGELPPPEPLVPAAWDPFLDAIARSPGDPGPRQVFADWLTTANHPLGPFTVQSLMPRTPELEDLRARAVLAHGETWLGPLSQIISPAAADFSKGIVRGGIISLRDEAADRLMDDPLFRVFEWLHFTEPWRTRLPGRTDALTQLSGVAFGEVPDPVLARLTHLGLTSETSTAQLARTLSRAPSLKALALIDGGTARDALALLERLPRLEIVELWLELASVDELHVIAEEAARRLPTVARVSVALTAPASGLPSARRATIERRAPAVEPFGASLLAAQLWLPLPSDEPQEEEAVDEAPAPQPVEVVPAAPAPKGLWSRLTGFIRGRS